MTYRRRPGGVLWHPRTPGYGEKPAGVLHHPRAINYSERPRTDLPLTIGGCVAWLRADMGITLSVPTINQSSAFDNAAWTKTNTTVVADDTTDPDGGTAADRITEVAGTFARSVSQTPGNIAAVTAKYRVRAKRSTLDFIYLEGNGGTSRVWFNLSTGALGTQTAGTGTIASLGNGWYLCEMSFAYTSGGMVIGVSRADNTTSYTVAGGDERALWLFNAEALQQRVSGWTNQGTLGGSVSQGTAAKQPEYLSSEANMNSQATVLFDGVDDELLGTISLGNGGDDAPMTVFCVHRYRTAPVNDFFWLSYTAADTTHRWEMLRDTAGVYMSQKVAGGVAANDSSTATVVNETKTLITLRSNGTTVDWFKNGTAEDQNQALNANALSAQDTVVIANGGALGNSRACHMTIAEIVHFNRALPVADLARIHGYLRARYAI